MNYRIIVSILGRVLTIEAGLLLAPLAVALLYGESLWPFVWTIVLALAAGGLLLALGRKHRGSLRPRE